MVMILIFYWLLIYSFGESIPLMVELKSRWHMFPYITMGSEYFGSTSYEDYWNYLNLVSEINMEKIVSCSKSDYEIAIELGEKVNLYQIDNYKLSMSVQDKLPKLEFIRQIVNEINYPNDCEYIFIVNGEIVCDFSKLKEKILDNNRTNKVVERKWDLVYNISNYDESAPLVYFITDIVGVYFGRYHKEMTQFASNGSIRYVVYNLGKIRCKNVANLAGYGAGLSIKDVSYRATNDQEINLFGESIPDKLLKYQYRNDTYKISTINEKEDLSEYFFAAIKYLPIDSEESRFKTLLEISTNLPAYIDSITKQTGSTYSERTEYHRHLQTINTDLNEFDSIYINGISLGDDITPFGMIPIFARELQTVGLLRKLGFNGDIIKKLLFKCISEKPYKFKLNVDSDLILWFNDVEKDRRYHGMSSNINQFNYFNFGQQVYSVRLNIFNVVLFLDPVSPTFYPIISAIHRMISNNVPIRFGLVIVTNMSNDISLALGRALSSLSKINIDLAYNFLEQLYSSGDINIDKIKEYYGEFDPFKAPFIHDQHHPSDEYLSKCVDFFKQLGLSQAPVVVFNGDVLDDNSIHSNFIYVIFQKYNEFVEEIKEKIRKNKLKIGKKTSDTFMTGPDFYSRINMNIASILSNNYNLPIPETYDDCDRDEWNSLTISQMYYCLLKAPIFISQQKSPIQTIWLIINPTTTEGLDLLKDVISKNYSVPVRFGVIFTSSNTIDEKPIISDQLYHIISSSSLSISEIIQMLSNSNIPENIDLKSTRKLMKQLSIYRLIFSIRDDGNYVIHGKGKHGPIKSNQHDTTTSFSSYDLVLSLNLYSNTFSPLLDYDKEVIKSKASDLKVSYIDLIESIMNILSYRAGQHLYYIRQLRQPSRLFTLKLKPTYRNKVYVNVEVIINPISETSQKLMSLLNLIRQTYNCEIVIYLLQNEYGITKPSNRFYKYIISPKPSFSSDNNGELDEYHNVGIFENLPIDNLYTLHLDTPQSWFTQSIFANCDMDNIMLSESVHGCIGIYELEYLMIEGHAFNSGKGVPAAGLRLMLSTLSHVELFDTIVMQNLGYFQFKATAGPYIISLRNDDPPQPFTLISVTSLSTGSQDIIPIDTFQPHLIRVEVVDRDVSSDASSSDTITTDDDKGSIWSKISDYWSNSKESKKLDHNKTINIFTVATGLLYERFLRIMIISVLKHTKSPVKFWFLKNYLSPQFHKAIRILSENYNFEYEYVQYKWPHWLLKQTDKQRTIWGYKILFLDVLFPLSLDRIIFVDADQIVRADLIELNNMDLGRAPYAYTPFCNDRPEMARFRFWESGYWRDHLNGKPYHISALYIVDLRKFRESMTGDRLRGQYQMLSRDPNSLANLDQDLPNNLQHMIPIKSLPIEWLWCETWCSDRTKSSAKTIDLCNNPLTYEAKLDRAKRITPEFIEYDNVINELLYDKKHSSHSEL